MADIQGCGEDICVSRRNQAAGEGLDDGSDMEDALARMSSTATSERVARRALGRCYKCQDSTMVRVGVALLARMDAGRHVAIGVCTDCEDDA
jgi:hypothetical protein